MDATLEARSTEAQVHAAKAGNECARGISLQPGATRMTGYCHGRGLLTPILTQGPKGGGGNKKQNRTYTFADEEGKLFVITSSSYALFSNTSLLGRVCRLVETAKSAAAADQRVAALGPLAPTGNGSQWIINVYAASLVLANLTKED